MPCRITVYAMPVLLQNRTSVLTHTPLNQLVLKKADYSPMTGRSIKPQERLPRLERARTLSPFISGRRARLRTHSMAQVRTVNDVFALNQRRSSETVKLDLLQRPNHF